MSGDAAGCTAELVGFQAGDGGVEALIQFTNTLTGQSQVVAQQLPPAEGDTCTILHIVIEPIRIELLGLIIETDRIELRITARRGTLLGDLLCGLFFGSQQDAGATATVLNQLLRQGMISVV